MTALESLLHSFRQSSVTEREKGTYFEELIVCYLTNEPIYKDTYQNVYTYAQWAKSQGLDAKDVGIDLVAETRGTKEFHAIQCKFYDADYKLQKRDIDSFFTASGKKTFSHRIIVTTTNNWSENAEDALQNQVPAVTKIDLQTLENSIIDWSQYQPKQTEPVFRAKKELREHQKHALVATTRGLEKADRGKLIMACGTGKTFTSLKISESFAGKGKRVLFLVPSLSLLSQTLTEWTQETETPIRAFAVCSDSHVGKKRKQDDDVVEMFLHELQYPATTEPRALAKAMAERHNEDHMTVVFSTYHSLEVLHKAQKDFQLAEFDLIICDEAHRTTGSTYADEEDSAFVKIHDADFIQGKKRLYMTATPRIYGSSAKVTAQKDDITLFSMDNEELYGKEFYVINFSEAVSRGLLVDYKVIVLAVDENHITRSLQDLLKDENNSLKVNDAAKIVGCWKALSKIGTEEDLSDDTEFMRRAVAFCQVIEAEYKGKTHKVSSKQIAEMFQTVVEAYQASELQDSFETPKQLACVAQHIDGGMNASLKEERLAWLRSEPPENTCHILSNVRCLSEGVDVPALDAVLFLTPRNSQVDVVQSVGRVMRRAADKKRGYIILPVVIPAGLEPSKALDDNVTYKVVWQVLQALRAHDDRFNAMINKFDLTGKDVSKMEIVAVTDQIAGRTTKASKEEESRGLAQGSDNLGKKGKASLGIGEGGTTYQAQRAFSFEVGEIERAIYAKIVQKCGNRFYWEDWAKDIASIAQTHIARITAIVENPKNTKEQEAFNTFATELRDDLNDSISNAEVIEMLAQHLITKPVFDALFSDYNFAAHNPMSQAMQRVIDVLETHHIDKEADTLERFYENVKMRADGIDNAQGKQRIIVELYDKFFRNAFPKMTERLGIVYTPIEVVDFIIHSVDHILKTEFQQSLGSEGVHIIDPFTGTGTFITRLLQSGLISPEQLQRKYQGEIHANEIVLLAYYIAAINIEAVYHSIVGGEYLPFNGICLTDTFQLYEKEDLVSELLVDNSARRTRQKKLDIRVVIGNPPYSAGQESANDNNQNIAYPQLDEKIRSSYAAGSKATNKNALYDSYIRAIRWASDRVQDSGVVGFVTNAGFLEANTADGLRKCLAAEFSSIYVFHLRGNARTSGELRRKEKDNIFGMGTRTPIAITILVKNPAAKEHGKIYWHDIGDYLSQQEKLDRIREFASIGGITSSNAWQSITPDEHGDWINQRDDSFGEFIAMGDKKDKSSVVLFENYSSGVKTQRDAWCYNSSKKHLLENIIKTVNFYNTEVDRFKSSSTADAKTFIEYNDSYVSWTRALIWDLEKYKKIIFTEKNVILSLYRPFTKQWLYYDRRLNEMIYQMSRIFPNAAAENLVIYLSGLGNSGKDFSVLIVNTIPDLNMQHSGGQGFPLYLYGEDTPVDSVDNNPLQLDFASPPSQTAQPTGRRDAITKEGLKHFQDAYKDTSITREDIFYYVYGLLHSAEYRTRYADNLTKELPRIPCVKKLEDFRAFSQAGRSLAELHLHYETVDMYSGVTILGTHSEDSYYRVEKMKYGKVGKDKDLTTVIYNDFITIKNIPLEAYEYIVNGKPALDWVMERQAVTTHKDSGIVNDANDWAIETMGNAKYPLELFLRVITVSLETMQIVNGLPKLDI